MGVAGGGEWIVRCVSHHGGAWRCVAVRGGGVWWWDGLTRFPESLAGDAGAVGCGGGGARWVDSIS